jgi:hypothetical protein
MRSALRSALIATATVTLILFTSPHSFAGERGYANYFRKGSGAGIEAGAALSYREPRTSGHEGPGPVVGMVSESTSTEPFSSAPIVDVAEAQALVPRVCALVYDSGLNPSYDLGETTTSAGCLGAIEDDPGRESGDRERGGRRRPTVVDVGALVSQALDRAIALAPAPGLEAAPSGIGLTGLPSYFWLDRVPQPISATASAGGLVVTAQAHPTSYVWDFGDGNDLTTTHAGRAWTRWREGNIEHLYETRGRYDIGVEVVWSASWSLNGGPLQSLGNFSTSDSRRYPVQEVVARLVPFR